MLGPKHQARDVAVLLEDGLRNGTIVLSSPETQQPEPRVEKRATYRNAWIPAVASVSIAIAFALVIAPAIEHSTTLAAEEWSATGFDKILRFLTTGPGVLISLPAILVGYHDLVRRVIELIERRNKMDKS
jgi:hypothetical protein